METRAVCVLTIESGCKKVWWCVDCCSWTRTCTIWCLPCVMQNPARTACTRWPARPWSVAGLPTAIQHYFSGRSLSLSQLTSQLKAVSLPSQAAAVARLVAKGQGPPESLRIPESQPQTRVSELALPTPPSSASHLRQLSSNIISMYSSPDLNAALCNNTNTCKNVHRRMYCVPLAHIFSPESCYGAVPTTFFWISQG